MKRDGIRMLVHHPTWDNALLRLGVLVKALGAACAIGAPPACSASTAMPFSDDTSAGGRRAVGSSSSGAPLSCAERSTLGGAETNGAHAADALCNTLDSSRGGWNSTGAPESRSAGMGPGGDRSGSLFNSPSGSVQAAGPTTGGVLGGPFSGIGGTDSGRSAASAAFHTGGRTSMMSSSLGLGSTNACRTGPDLSGLSNDAYAQNCVTCSGEDYCLQCICTHCTSEVRACSETQGCTDISACVQNSRCTGMDCYCGTHDALSCALGQADGPCREAMLNAPSGRVPTLANPSAGPASDAAVAVATCLDKDGSECKKLCH